MRKIINIFSVLTIVIFTTSSLLLAPQITIAATISAAYDKMSNENTSALSTHLIKFRAPGGVTASGNTIVITFPSDFDFTGSVIGDLTMKEGVATGLENSETLGSSAGVSQWGAVFSGTQLRVLTLTAPTSGNYYVAANDFVTVAYVSTHAKNPTTSGSKSITIATTADSGTIAVPIITSSTVTLDATVAPTLSFSNDNTTLHFGTLSASQATYANTTTGTNSDVVGNTFTISTNATTGYTLAYNAAATLTSGSNTIAAVTINNSATGTPGTAGGQFAMSGVYTNGSGGGTLTSTYNHATGSGNWKFNTAGETLVSATGPVNADTVAMHYLANISNVTPAGVYSQTNTWVVTANF